MTLPTTSLRGYMPSQWGTKLRQGMVVGYLNARTVDKGEMEYSRC